MTDEDFDCWLWVMIRWRRRLGAGTSTVLEKMSFEQNVTDAALMFQAQRVRSYTFPVDMPPVALIGAFGGATLDVGGALREWKTLNLAYFA